MDALATVLEIFGGNLRPSYALLKSGDKRARMLWDKHKIQIVEYADYGDPLVELVAELAPRVSAGPAKGDDLDAGPRIFISYRRSDRALAAHWVHREVAARFGKEEVFFDVDGIPAGFDYRDFLQEQVNACDVLLAVIGDDWLDVRDAEGRRRLENASDFVRIEIEAALKRQIPIIPVLVENAHMPAARDLPASLHELAYRQAREVRSGHHLDDHFRRLNESIEQAWRIHTERLKRTRVPEQGRQVAAESQRAVGRNIITNSLGMKLTAIPAGRFVLGSPENEPGRQDKRRPTARSRIDARFLPGICPVTQDEYRQVVGSNPSGFASDGLRPVERVSWLDAVAFCNRLSEREQLTPFYAMDGNQVQIAGGNGYRLPTEAEWEYACRAGRTTAGGSVTTSRDWVSSRGTTRIPMRRRIRWVKSRRTIGDCTTCMAMFGNGAGIGSASIRRAA